MNRTNRRSEVLNEFEKCFKENREDFQFIVGEVDGFGMKTVLKNFICTKCDIEIETADRFIEHILPCKFTNGVTEKFRVGNIVERNVLDVIELANEERLKRSSMEITFTDQPHLKMSIKLGSELCKFFENGMLIFSKWIIFRESFECREQIDGLWYGLKFVEKNAKVGLNATTSHPEVITILSDSENSEDDEIEETFRATPKRLRRRVGISSSSSDSDEHMANLPSTSTAKLRPREKKLQGGFLEGLRRPDLWNRADYRKMELDKRKTAETPRKVENVQAKKKEKRNVPIGLAGPLDEFLAQCENLHVVAPDIVKFPKSRDVRTTRDLAEALNMPKTEKYTQANIEKAVRRKFGQSDSEKESESSDDEDLKKNAKTYPKRKKLMRSCKTDKKPRKIHPRKRRKSYFY